MQQKKIQIGNGIVKIITANNSYNANDSIKFKNRQNIKK